MSPAVMSSPSLPILPSNFDTTRDIHRIRPLKSSANMSSRQSSSSKPRKLVFHPLTFDKSSGRSNRHISISGPLHVQTHCNYVFTSNPSTGSALSTPISGLASPRTPSPVFFKLDEELRSSNSEVQLADDIKLVVPTIVKKCIDFLEEHDPVEGVFRINGSIRKIKIIESAIKHQGIDDFNFDSFQPEGEDLPNCYDVAMVLKRWLANLENGLITPQTSKKLKDDMKAKGEDCFDEEERLGYDYCRAKGGRSASDSLASGKAGYDESDIVKATVVLEVSKVDNDSSETLSSASTIKNDSDVVSAASTLAGLPVQNLNLFVYLVNFLSRLSTKEMVQITKMTASNLAKIFQLSFFKSDDLLSRPFCTSTSLLTQTSDSLLHGYRVNERLLLRWIQQCDSLTKELQSVVKARDSEMTMLLAEKPKKQEDAISSESIYTHSSLASHSARGSTIPRSRSMFGRRSFSNMFSASTFSLARKPSTDGSVDSATSKQSGKYPGLPVHRVTRRHPRSPLNDATGSIQNAPDSRLRPRKIVRSNSNTHISTKLADKNNSTTTSVTKAVASSKPEQSTMHQRHKRPQSMFIERRLSSLFHRDSDRWESYRKNHPIANKLEDIHEDTQNELHSITSSFSHHHRHQGSIRSNRSDKENTVLAKNLPDDTNAPHKSKRKLLRWFRQSLM